MVPLGPARFAVRVLVVMTFPAVCIPASGNDGGGNGPAVDGPILYAPITLGLGDHALRDTLLMALHIAAVDPVETAAGQPASVVPHAISINDASMRFVDESLGYVMHGKAVLDQPGQRTTLVFDQAIRGIAGASGRRTGRTGGADRPSRRGDAGNDRGL